MYDFNTLFVILLQIGCGMCFVVYTFKSMMRSINESMENRMREKKEIEERYKND